MGCLRDDRGEDIGAVGKGEGKILLVLKSYMLGNFLDLGIVVAQNWS